VRQPAGARCRSTKAGNGHSDHAISADIANRLVALVLEINVAADDPRCYAHGTAVPAQRVDRHTPSPVIGRPAEPTRGISSGGKLVEARQQVSGRATDAINLSSVRSFFPSRSDVYVTGHDVLSDVRFRGVKRTHPVDALRWQQ
jgi:hypothetical protein